MTRITVIIPTYNRPQRTQRAVESVLLQDFHDIEILIIDDGSIPPIELTCAAASDARCRVLRLERNFGAATARSVGLEAAKGTWIAFLDSDDQWIPNTLQKRLSEAESHFAQHRNPLAVYGCSWDEVDRTGARLRSRRPRSSARVFDFVTGCWFAPGSTVLFKREAILAAIGGQDSRLRLLEDFDWFLRLALQGGEFVGQDIVGARIERGGKPSLDLLEESISVLIGKWTSPEWASQLPPGSHRALRAYLDVERAASAWFGGKPLSALFWFMRSWLLVPRTTLLLSPGWT